MKIIDQYILKRFIKVLMGCFLSFTGLFIVIDAVGNLDEFLNYGEKGGGLFSVLLDYYGARSLVFFDRVSGLIALLAALFVVSWLQRTHELTAIMTGGISKLRIVKPLIIGVVLVSLLAVGNREFLIPVFREKLLRNAQDWLGEAARPMFPRYDNETDILFGGRNTFASEQRIAQPDFLLPDSLRHVGRRLAAENAFYQHATGNRPGGYLLDKVRKPDDLFEQPNVFLNDKPVILTPLDTSWLELDQCFVVSQVDFDRLAYGSQYNRFSSTSELTAGLRNPGLDYGSDVRVTVHARMVQPLLDLTLLMLGLPIMLSQSKRNVFLSVGMCLAAVGFFFVVMMGCHLLGNNALISPAFAAWCPLIILAPLAAGFSQPFWE